MNQCTKWITKLPIVLDARVYAPILLPKSKHNHIYICIGSIKNIRNESMYKMDNKVAHCSRCQGVSSNITPKI